MNRVSKSFKFRIYPSESQIQMFNKTFGCTRFVWNKLVENFNLRTPSFKPPKVSEKTLKSTEEFDFLNEVSAASLQQVRRDFDSAKSQYFNKDRKKKLGRMKFKSRKDKNTFRLPNQKFTVNRELGVIRLEKIGWVQVKFDRIIPDDAKYMNITVSKSPTGKYYCSINAEVDVELMPITGRTIGIDMGTSHFATLSNGVKIDNPRWFRENQARLKKAQQHLSRKKKGSNRYEKQRIKVAKIHEEISNQRRYFQQNLSTEIVRNYDVICVEDLNIAGMLKNPFYASSISDSSWGSFVDMLRYKSDWYGKSFVQVDRFYPSTKTCNVCGFKTGYMSPSIREWSCPECVAHHDRDMNAAINIHRQGYADLTGQQSVESIDYIRGDGVSLFDARHHLAVTVNRIETL